MNNLQFGNVPLLGQQPTITLQAQLTDANMEQLRQMMQDELAKVFPTEHKKPDMSIPTCPDCGQWDLAQHSKVVPLEGDLRAWWCSCPEKVQAWEVSCQQGLDDLLAAIHDPHSLFDSEIEAMLVEMDSQELEALIERVKKARA